MVQKGSVEEQHILSGVRHRKQDGVRRNEGGKLVVDPVGGFLGFRGNNGGPSYGPINKARAKCNEYHE